MRFPNYNSAWQKNKFGNLLTLLKNNTLSRAELNYENGKIKDIHYGDVLIKFNDFVLSDSKIIPYINDDRIPHNYADLLLKTGDLVIADTAEDYTVGKATELIFNDQSLIISGLHTIPCRPINNIFGSKYLGYYINSPSFHNQLLPLIQGIKVSSISKSQIIDTFISYPKINEQCKITEFLTLIDQRIDTQSKIIEKYESLINYIRHKLFTGYINDDINNQKYIFNKIFISYKKLNEQSLQQYTIGKNGIKSMSNHLNYSINSHIVFMPNTLILGIGIDEIGVSIDTTGCCSPIYKTYTINNEIVDTLFLNIFANDYFSMIKNRVTQKSTRREFEFDYKELAKTLFTLPDIEIQKKDAQIVNKFYFKLQKEKDILELYKKQKAYLLKNMFI